MLIKYTSLFKRDFKSLKKMHYDISKIKNIVYKLQNYEENSQELRIKYKDHALQGNWKGFRELHIEIDILLIYKIEKDKLVLTLVRLGKHDDIL